MVTKILITLYFLLMAKSAWYDKDTASTVLWSTLLIATILTKGFGI